MQGWIGEGDTEVAILGGRLASAPGKRVRVDLRQRGWERLLGEFMF